MLEKRSFYINGSWTAPLEGRDHPVINPSTEQADAIISLGGQKDTDAAVAAARAAFPAWMNTPSATRIKLVEKLLEQYNQRRAALAEAVSLEMGAPIDMAHREQITPWNWPMNQVSLKVAAAAIAGCTMVLKPSEESPLNAMIFAEAVDAAGFPPGVFNLINGDGAGVGTQLSVHPDVDMVSFTGSTRAGTLITKAAADSLKRVTLELGGKGANIIFNDADAKAVKRGVLHCMNNTGQSCNAPTRMLVQREVYDQAVATATEVAGIVQVGPAHESGRHIGPVVNEVQFNKIQALIQKGIDEGARLVAGGTGRPDGMEKGFYVQPTIFADVTNQMTISREEIFGPVLSILPFDTEEEAIEMANDTVYGLTNYIQTQDSEKGKRVARQLRSGMVEMNGQSRGAGAPFGGMKQSGNGREGGVWGLEDFLEVKSVSGWAG